MDDLGTAGATGTTPPGLSSPFDAALDRILARLEDPAYQERASAHEAAAAEKAETACQVRSAAAAENLWRRRGQRYRECRLENYQVTHASQRVVVDALLAYAGRIAEQVAAGTNVVLVGPAGTGKDHLLAGLVHHALAARLTVDWRTGATLWLELRQAIQSGHESRCVDALTRADVLVLSDPVPPHAEPTNYERSVLYGLVDRRYSDCRPIWVSINAAGRLEAEQRLGVAVVDRLRHGALSLACDWPSYRQPGRWGAHD